MDRRGGAQARHAHAGLPRARGDRGRRRRRGHLPGGRQRSENAVSKANCRQVQDNWQGGSARQAAAADLTQLKRNCEAARGNRQRQRKAAGRREARRREEPQRTATKRQRKARPEAPARKARLSRKTAPGIARESKGTSRKVGTACANAHVDACHRPLTALHSPQSDLASIASFAAKRQRKEAP